MSSNQRVVRVWREVAALLDSLPLEAYADVPTREQATATAAILRTEARVAAHKMAAARAVAASGAAQAEGASSPGQMFANTLGGDRRAADRMLLSCAPCSTPSPRPATATRQTSRPTCCSTSGQPPTSATATPSPR